MEAKEQLFHRTAKLDALGCGYGLGVGGGLLDMESDCDVRRMWVGIFAKISLQLGMIF